jgi:glutamate carboxypeptidase
MIDTRIIQKHLQDHLHEYLEYLRKMVGINSFTTNPKGVNRLGEFTSEMFAPLGFEAEFVQSKDKRLGKHLFLSRPPVGLKLQNEIVKHKYLGMISHLDTVFSPEEEINNNFQWRPIGDQIYGPGTIDIKGGTVMVYMVLDALRNFAAEIFDSTGWLICLNACEEVLSEDFSEFCLERLPLNTLACLVFEGGTQVADAMPLVVSRKGRATYLVQVEGRSAHAGNYHAQGANAILQIAHTVQKIASFTNYDQDITFNVGTINGGTVVNRVPHYAEANIEMRAFSPEIFQEGVDKMLALNGSSQVSSADGYPCKVSVTVNDRSAPWPPNPETQRLFDLWSSIANQLRLTVIPEARGGLSDGNLLWDHFPTLDGLGPVGGNAHCSERDPEGDKDQEYVLVSSFIPKALMNTLAILHLIESESIQ